MRRRQIWQQQRMAEAQAKAPVIVEADPIPPEPIKRKRGRPPKVKHGNQPNDH